MKDLTQRELEELVDQPAEDGDQLSTEVEVADTPEVGDLGRAAGLVYQDDEPLHSTDLLAKRDNNRWELNPASSEDYQERARKQH